MHRSHIPISSHYGMMTYNIIIMYIFIVTCVGGSKVAHILYHPYYSALSVWPILNVQ